MKPTTMGISLLALCAGFHAQAQSAVDTAQDAYGPAALEEVRVTATKRETRLQDTAIRVDVFSAEYLQHSDVRKFSELAGALPNMAAPDGVTGTQNVTIRGVSSPGRGFGLEQPIGVYLDGVFAPPGSLDSYLLDLGQIEVIRGPQGAVWGRNTLAGAISYTTARPTAEFSGYVRGQLGNKDLRDIQFALSGPMGSDSVLFRLAGASIKQDGFSRRISGGTYGDKDQVALRGTLQFLPGEALDIRLIVDYSNNDYYSPVPEYFSGPFAVIAGTDGYTRRQDTDYYRPSRTRTWGTTLLVDYDFSGLTLSSVTGYRSIERLQFLDTDGTNQFLINENVDSDADQFSQELRLGNGTDTRASWMVGVYYYTRKDDDRGGSDVEGTPFGLPGVVNTESVHSNQDTTSIAAFASLDYAMTDALKLQAAIRAEREKKSQDATQGSVLVFPGGPVIPLFAETYSADLHDNTVSPMLGLSYQVQDHVLAYASWSRGHKSGGFNSPRVANPRFGPEQADSFEAGAKTTWLDGRVLFNVVGFYIDYKDMQIRGLELTPTGPAQAFYNAGAMTSKGLEVELSTRPTDFWNVYASFGYNDAEFDSFVIHGPGAAADLSGNTPAFAPKTSFSLRSDVHIDVGGLGEAYARGEWNYTGSYYLDFNNVPIAGRQKSFSLLNLRLGLITSSGFEIALWGRNLTDKDYKIDFIGDLPPVLFHGSQSHLLAPGRTWGVEAAFRF